MYNFSLVLNPITDIILKYVLSNSGKVRRMSFDIEKNRESRAYPRNKCYMEPVQYQEAVHALALMLIWMNGYKPAKPDSLFEIFPSGLTVAGRSKLYDPVSPGYKHFPDGLFDGKLRADGLDSKVRVNFKRFSSGLPTIAQKKVKINAEGLDIIANYQYGDQFLSINGRRIKLPDMANPHRLIWERVIAQFESGQKPILDSNFAYLTYLLSAALWKASHQESDLQIKGVPDLEKAARTYVEFRDAGKLVPFSRNMAKETAKFILDWGLRLVS
jgi:hypothetical protein